MKISLLDHGYVEVIDVLGSDQRIIEAARMSTDKGFLGWGPIHPDSCLASAYGATIADCTCHDPKPGDENLLRYLYENKHASPFEFGELVIEVQAPIVVFREWQRHRTQSYNEMSARYTALPDLFYLPDIQRMMASKQSSMNKQSSDQAATFTEAQADSFRRALETSYRDARLRYELLLNAGVAREIARLVIPVAQYSRMRAKANLRNWLAFLTLRMDEKAQWEIRQYANVIGLIIAQHFPRTWNLFIGKK